MSVKPNGVWKPWISNCSLGKEKKLKEGFFHDSTTKRNDEHFLEFHEQTKACGNETSSCHSLECGALVRIGDFGCRVGSSICQLFSLGIAFWILARNTTREKANENVDVWKTSAQKCPSNSKTYVPRIPHEVYLGTFDSSIR